MRVTISPFQKLSFNKTLMLTYVSRKFQQGTLGAEEGPPYPQELLGRTSSVSSKLGRMDLLSPALVRWESYYTWSHFSPQSEPPRWSSSIQPAWQTLSFLFMVSIFYFYYFGINRQAALDSLWSKHQSVQFNSVAQSGPTLCNPMNRRTPGLPVHHHLPEFTQTHVHQVSDAIQPSHPPSSPSPPAPNPSQHQSLFQWVNSSHEVTKVLEFQL